MAAFIHAAGPAYCPSGVIGIGVVWAIALLLIALLRPVLGGNDYGYIPSN